jgi:hypothetical protein
LLFAVLFVLFLLHPCSAISMFFARLFALLSALLFAPLFAMFLLRSRSAISLFCA